MEQKDDFKLELQQELRGLQQDIEQHSTFNTEVWRRSVKRYTRSLYRQNILSVVFLVVMLGVSYSILVLVAHWPWWLVVPGVIFFCVLIIDNLIITRGMAHPDVESKEGLLSLRATIQANTNKKRWRIWFYSSFAALFLLATYIYLWFNDRPMFFNIVFVNLISIPVGRRAAKRMKNRYDELIEEIDELLKEG